MDFETFVWNGSWDFYPGGTYNAYWKYLSKNNDNKDIKEMILSIEDQIHQNEMIKLFNKNTFEKIDDIHKDVVNNETVEEI